jgi:hypothetical protein
MSISMTYLPTKYFVWMLFAKGNEHFSQSANFLHGQAGLKPAEKTIEFEAGFFESDREDEGLLFDEVHQEDSFFVGDFLVFKDRRQ